MNKKITGMLCLLLTAAMVLGACAAPVSTESASAGASATAGASADTSATAGATDSVIVAEVDGEPIYYDDYYAAYSSICAQYGISEDDESYASMIQESAIDSLVTEKILAKELTAQGYMDLNEEQMAEAEATAQTDINSAVDYYYKAEIEEKLGEGYTQEQYAAEAETYKQQMLDGVGQTWEQVVDSYKVVIAEEAAKAVLLADLVPTDDEIRTEYDTQVATNTEAMDADPTLYESAVMSGTTIYYAPAGIRYVKQILVSIDADANAAISLLRENAYDDAADTLLEKALADIKAEADDVLEKINSGEITFDEAVATYNEDTGMPETGYAVSAGSDTFYESFTAGAMGLKNIGDVSELVSTDYGYHIIQYASDVTPGAVAYEDVKDKIAENLKTTLQAEKWAGLQEEWKANSKIVYYPENY